MPGCWTWHFKRNLQPRLIMSTIISNSSENHADNKVSAGKDPASEVFHYGNGHSISTKVKNIVENIYWDGNHYWFCGPEYWQKLTRSEMPRYLKKLGVMGAAMGLIQWVSDNILCKTVSFNKSDGTGQLFDRQRDQV